MALCCRQGGLCGGDQCLQACPALVRHCRLCKRRTHHRRHERGGGGRKDETAAPVDQKLAQRRGRQDQRTFAPQSLAAGGQKHRIIAALKPDVALFHAQVVDREGNVWIGVHKELMTLAHASTKTLVTFETLYDGDLLADEKMAAGTIPSIYVSGLAEAKKGAWPIALPAHYERDAAINIT